VIEKLTLVFANNESSDCRSNCISCNRRRLLIVCLCLMRLHAEGRIPVSGHRRLSLFKNNFIAARGGAGWLTSWNSTTVPGISPEALRIGADPKKQRMGYRRQDSYGVFHSRHVHELPCKGGLPQTTQQPPLKVQTSSRCSPCCSPPPAHCVSPAPPQKTRRGSPTISR
jgi:hypothetical protein